MEVEGNQTTRNTSKPAQTVVVVVLPRRVFVEGPAAAGHRPARAATLDPRGVSDKRKILEQAPVEEKEKRWPEEEPEKR